MFKKGYICLMNSGNSEHGSMNPEMLAKDEVKRLVDAYDRVYHLPAEVRENGLMSEIKYVTSGELVTLAVEDYLRRHPPPVISGIGFLKAKFFGGKSEVDEKLARVAEQAKGLFGLAIPREEDDGTSIYIDKEAPDDKQEHIKRHEMAHALARIPGKHDSGFADSNDVGNSLNEAAAELIVLGLDNPEMNTTDDKWGLYHMKIESYYRHYVQILEVAMQFTEKTNPMSIKDLAALFFKPGISAKERREQFRDTIKNRMEGRREAADDLINGLIDPGTRKPSLLIMNSSLIITPIAFNLSK